MSKIILFPNDVLRQKSTFFDFSSNNINLLSQKMIDIMNEYNGIGLAAVQINIPVQVFIICLDKKNDPTIFINPTITYLSEEKINYQEGCLSIPNVHANINRSSKIIIKYTDCNQGIQELHASDLLSICIQHEMDHLNGILFIDYLSKYKKSKLLDPYFKNN